MKIKKDKKLRIMLDFSLTLLHHGHIRLIRNAKEYFKDHETTIVIGLVSDDEIKKHKGFKSELKFEYRKEIMEALKYVDEVVSTPYYITKKVLNDYDIDYLVHGTDNNNSVENILILPRTENISSDILRERAIHSIVQKRNSNKNMFTPGPSNMSQYNMLDLKSAFGRGDEEYQHIEEVVLNNILKITGHDKIVRFQGGGTNAVDVATSNIVLGKILIIDSGYYSNRIESIISKKIETLPNTSFKVIKYSDIKKEFEIGDTYDWIATAYVETADAFLSDIKLLKKLADYKKAKLFLDATASINLEPNHDLSDACTFSSCKGLGGLTGAAFITYKDTAYSLENKGNIPFTMDLNTHINKLYTGPYHAICSLYTISNSFKQITENVKLSKSLFLKKYHDKIIRQDNNQPLISTMIKANKIETNKNSVLYQPRTSLKGTAVICHLGDMFSSIDNIGEIYNVLLIE